MRSSIRAVPALLALCIFCSSASAQNVLWTDVTFNAGNTLGVLSESTLKSTKGWTHKVVAADLDEDGLPDLLFANGPGYSTPGAPELNRIFLNRDPATLAVRERRFRDISLEVFGADGADIARTIQVGDVNGDDHLDIFVGAAYHKIGPFNAPVPSKSRLFFGKGDGTFEEKTDTHLPKKGGKTVTTSMGDAAFGDMDGDGDLDLILANWGVGDPCRGGVPGCGNVDPPNASKGGRIGFWRNNGKGKFSDATSKMPKDLVRFSWDLEVVDVDNDMDLDVVIASKATLGKEKSYLYINKLNEAAGKFVNASDEQLPSSDVAIQTQIPPPVPRNEFTNNYEFEIIDINNDGAWDLITLNDGASEDGTKFDLREHILVNDGKGTFTDQTKTIWPDDVNVGDDDNHAAVFDFDSDGDQDFLIGSLFGGADRLMINQNGVLQFHDIEEFDGLATDGTLGIIVADLNADGREDVVQSQGEAPEDSERVYFATSQVPKDTAAPIVQLAGNFIRDGKKLIVRARIHDAKTPVALHHFSGRPVVRLPDGKEVPMRWVGGALWRADLTVGAAEEVLYKVCATDAAENPESCSEQFTSAP